MSAAMTRPDLAGFVERRDTAADTSDVANIAVLALLLVLLLVAGFSVVTQWTVEGLRPPQVATVEE
jgi:hypothetical protein